MAALSIHSSFISRLLGNGKQDLGFAHKCRYSAAGTGCLLVQEKSLWVVCAWDAFERKRGELTSVLSSQDSDPKSEQKRDAWNCYELCHLRMNGFASCDSSVPGA